MIKTGRSEHTEQVTVINWAEAMKHTWPQLGLLHAIPNGGFRNPATAALLKAEGVKPGIPDIFLPVAKGGYHGMYLEMKRQHGGKLSDAQKEMRSALTWEGYRVVVCNGASEAIQAIKSYIGMDN